LPDVVTVIVLLVVVAAIYLLIRAMSPKKCPACGEKMTKMSPFDSGRTKKFRCPKCHRVVDTGIPVGRGRG
jgi:transposase-like protein